MGEKIEFIQLSSLNWPIPERKVTGATLNISTTLYGILAFRKKMRMELFQDMKVTYTRYWLDHEINSNRNSHQVTCVSEAGLSLALKTRSGLHAWRSLHVLLTVMRSHVWSLGTRGWMEGS